MVQNTQIIALDGNCVDGNCMDGSVFPRRLDAVGCSSGLKTPPRRAVRSG